MKKLLNYLTTQLLNSYQGFTLIETIASLGVLLFGIVTSLTLMTATFSSSKETEQVLVVVNLAREGIELVRNIRDTESQGFSALSDGEWIIDADNFLLTIPAQFSGSEVITNCTNCTLKLSASNKYNHTLGTNTIFKRMVTITPVSVWEKEIISEVMWQDRGRTHTFLLEDHLTDWR